MNLSRREEGAKPSSVFDMASVMKFIFEGEIKD